MSAQQNQTAGPSTGEPPKAANGEKKPLEQLGALEEDDEFEEFPAEDWPESATTLAALSSAGAVASSGQQGATAANGTAGMQLWEDNWDDDDKEPAFTNQLRAELKKQSDPNAMKI